MSFTLPHAGVAIRKAMGGNRPPTATAIAYAKLCMLLLMLNNMTSCGKPEYESGVIIHQVGDGGSIERKELAYIFFSQRRQKEQQHHKQKTEKQEKEIY